MDTNQQKLARQTIKLGTVDESDQLWFSLHREATYGTRKTLKKILLDAKYVDYPNNLGQTPLFCACATNNEGTALLLLETGANPNEKSLDGMTPLHAVCFRGNICLLDKLIDAGGDLRLHDNNGCSMKDWALKIPDVKKNAKMLEFLDQTHILAMTYSDTGSLDFLSRLSRRSNRKSLLKKVSRRASFEGTESLKQVQSVGFGKMYIGSDQTRGGLMTVIPLITENELVFENCTSFDCGFNTHMQQCDWLTTPVSVKQVKPDTLSDDGIDLIISDVEQLGKLRHQNILLMMGVCQQTSLDIMIVFERINYATLYHLLHQTDKSLLMSEKLCIAQQTCAAMEFIQNQKLLHCGLSSMAIYLISTRHAKVGNFEFMLEWSKAKMGKLSAVSQVSYRGFLYNWMSPELLKGQTPNYTADVYSFCTILWEMYSENIPWSGKEPDEIYNSVITNKMTLDLKMMNIPTKLTPILGYGLELREEQRLNKFSCITNWLKADGCQVESDIVDYQCQKEDAHTIQVAEDVELRNKNKKKSSQKNQPLSTSKECFNSTPALINEVHDFAEKQVATNGKFLVKPASHRNSGGNVWDSYLVQSRNNNGQLQPMIGINNSKLCRTSSQPQLRSNVETERMMPSLNSKTNSVRQLAHEFQEQVQAHSLRQSILKGSMAPGGKAKSDLDITFSSEEIKFDFKDGEKKTDSRQLKNACSDSASNKAPVALPPLALPPLCLNSSTPKTSNQVCKQQNKYRTASPSSIVQVNKVLKDRGTDTFSIEQIESQENQQVIVEKSSECTPKKISLPASGNKIGTKNSLFQEKEKFHACSPIDSILRLRKESLPDCINKYQSPTVEVHASDTCFDMSLLDSCMNTSYPCQASFSKDKNICDDKHNEDDSFWNSDLIAKKNHDKLAEEKSTDICVSSKSDIANDYSTNSVIGQFNLKENDAYNEGSNSHCERMSKYFKSLIPAHSKTEISSQIPAPETEDTLAPEASRLDIDDLNGFLSDGTFTIEVLEPDNMENLTIEKKDTDDFDGLDEWVENQLALIEKKMRLKYQRSDIKSLKADIIKTKSAGGGDNQCFKIQSAKSVPEADGCDFEFQEFYIDDDFGSTEKMEKEVANIELDCNLSTHIRYDASDHLSSSKSADQNSLIQKIQKANCLSIFHSGHHLVNEINLNKCNSDEGKANENSQTCTSEKNMIDTELLRNMVPETANFAFKDIEVTENGSQEKVLIGKRVFHSKKETSGKNIQFTNIDSQSISETNKPLLKSDQYGKHFSKVSGIVKKNSHQTHNRDVLPQSRISSAVEAKNVQEKSATAHLEIPIIKITSSSSIEQFQKHLSPDNSIYSGVEVKNVKEKSDTAHLEIPLVRITSSSSTEQFKKSETDKIIEKGSEPMQSMNSGTNKVQQKDNSRCGNKHFAEKNDKTVQDKDAKHALSDSDGDHQVSDKKNRQHFSALQVKDTIASCKDDCSSSDSDPWVKKNLKRIRMKIMKRRSREKYYASSDENLSNQDDFTIVTNVSSCTSIDRKLYQKADDDHSDIIKVNQRNCDKALKKDVSFEKCYTNTNKMRKKVGLNEKRNKKWKRKELQYSREALKNVESLSKFESEADTLQGPFKRDKFDKSLDIDGQSMRQVENKQNTTDPSIFENKNFRRSVVYHDKCLQKKNSKTSMQSIERSTQSISCEPSQNSSIHTMTKSELRLALEKTLQTKLEEQENQYPWSKYAHSLKQSSEVPISDNTLSDSGAEYCKLKPPTLIKKPPHKSKSVSKSSVKKFSNGPIGFERYMQSEELTNDYTDYHIGFEKIEEELKNQTIADKSSSKDNLYPKIPLDSNSENIHFIERCEKRLPMMTISNVPISEKMQPNEDKKMKNKFSMPKQRQHYSNKTKSLQLHDGEEPNENIDHYLTVGLSAAENQEKDVMLKKSTGFGIHRFYIPKEMWPDGCKAKLNVQVDPLDPTVHRVTSRAEDPTTGRSEVLLDQTLVTTKLKSTLQID